MNLRYSLLVLVDLSTSLALTLPLNLSLSPIGTDSDVLSAWPPQLPWSLDLSFDLSIEVVSYGTFAQSQWWGLIERNLNDDLRRINLERGGPEGDLAHRFYDQDFTLIGFHDLEDSPAHPREPRISHRDAVTVLTAIRDIYFLNKNRNNPRELGLQIHQRGEREVHMYIRWLRDAQSRWPDPGDLPFMVRVKHDKFMQINWYSKNVYPSISRQLEETLQSFTQQFVSEGPYERPPSKRTYSHTFQGLTTRLGVQIAGPAPGALTRGDMINSLKRIGELFFSPGYWEPRQLTADIMSDRGVLGTMSLIFDHVSL
ncbi:MAG: hypothetical protein LQ350_005143 [Teloschistes chrysophthalmus]|nr:MAG: hypothetical protein LQ350_005143 [Niorma chrysophthalma]